jgi:ATP-binding protein involved in chromosome partitioning
MKELDIDIMGVVMNMVYMMCPDCGKKLYLFEKHEYQLPIPILQEISMSRSIVDSTNIGIPVVLQDNATEEKNIFLELAENIRRRL